jgi:hypothetical protein
MTGVTAAAMPQAVAVPGQPGHGPAQANPWFFFAAGIWFIILVIHALRAYLGPPVGPLAGTSAAPSRRRNSIARSSG